MQLITISEFFYIVPLDNWQIFLAVEGASTMHPIRLWTPKTANLDVQMSMQMGHPQHLASPRHRPRIVGFCTNNSISLLISSRSVFRVCLSTKLGLVYAVFMNLTLVMIMKRSKLNQSTYSLGCN